MSTTQAPRGRVAPILHGMCGTLDGQLNKRAGQRANADRLYVPSDRKAQEGTR